MLSTQPSFWTDILNSAPQIMNAMSNQYGDPQLKFAANNSSNFSRFQRSQNGQGIGGLISNGGPPQQGVPPPNPMSNSPANPTPRPMPGPMNTGPSRNIMGAMSSGGGMDSGSQTQFGGRNFSDGQLPSALTYRMGTGGYRNFQPVDANSGNNLWNTYNRMSSMSPNGNNLIY